MSGFMKKLAPAEKAFIEKLLRDDNQTLDAMLDAIRCEFPASSIPSRSALGRAKKNYAAEVKEFREIAAASEILVREFGEDPDDKGGMLLAQAVQAVVTKRALSELTNDGSDETKPQMDIDAVGALARAAKHAIDAKAKAVDSREEIRRIAQEELIAKQKAKLEELGQSGEVDRSVLNKVIKAAYGLEI